MESFDGRTRVLRSAAKTIYEKFSTSEVQDSAPLGCEIPHPSSRAHTYKREKNEKKDSSSSVSSYPQNQKTRKNEEEDPSPEEWIEIDKRYAESCAYARSQGKRLPIKSSKWISTTLKDIRSSSKAALEAPRSSILENRTIASNLEFKLNTETLTGIKVEVREKFMEIYGSNDGYSMPFIISFADKDFIPILSDRLKKMGINFDFS